MIAVVLAAGRGARLGGVAKALLSIEGESFLARVTATLAAAGGGTALVVVGPPHGERVRAEAERLGLAVVENPQPERGMGSSVAIGFAALAGAGAGEHAALLWPVDCARVAAPTVAAVMAAASSDRIVVPTWQGRGGHPAAFGRAVWGELAAAGALPEGARSILHRDPARVTRLPVDDPGVLADVDVPADLGRAP